MSEKARAALIDIGTRCQGQTPPPITDAAIREELATLGYLGKRHGLTRRGSIIRERILNAEMEARFS